MKFIQAVLILSGMIIGVGMFAIPFSFAASGFWPGMAVFAVVAAIVAVIHVCYGDVVLLTPEFHRLPGYVRLHLGSKPAWLAYGSAIFGIGGTLVAYILLGGFFLESVIRYTFAASPSSALLMAIFAGAGALITLLPLNDKTLINGILTLLLVGFILMLSVVLLPYAKVEHFSGFSPGRMLAPYGVLMFAFSGAAVIPDLIGFLGRETRASRRAIVVGSLIPPAVYVVFVAAVVGASGAVASPDAIAGLIPVIGERAVAWGSAIGFLAVFTSYIVLTSSFQAFFRYDLGAGRRMASALGVVVPLLFLFIGVSDYIAVIAAVGALSFGLDAAMIFLMYRLAHRGLGDSRALFGRATTLVLAVISCMIAVGMGYEIYKILA